MKIDAPAHRKAFGRHGNPRGIRIARSVEAGSTTETVTELGVSLPPGVFSLSHLLRLRDAAH